MKCPFCSYEESKVIDSRPTDEGERIRRRRECMRVHTAGAVDGRSRPSADGTSGRAGAARAAADLGVAA